MKRILVLLITMVHLNAATAQDSTDYYIDRLSCGSIFLKINYGTELRLDREAEALVTMKDKRIAKKLVCAIVDSQKTAAIHAILTKRFEPEKYKFSAESVRRGDSTLAVDYEINGLKWRIANESNRCSIDREDIQRIKAYWETKLKVGTKKR